MSDLIFPTLDLFVYDLRNALNSTEAEKQQNQANFLGKLPANIKLSDHNLETEYLELLPKQKYYDFTTADKTLDGYYYPVRLNDTYGLQIDCSINNQIEPQTTNCFALLKAELEARLQGNTATIGQTWMLSGWLPKQSPKSYEQIAQSCYYSFQQASNWSQDLQGEGNLFGGRIFELWRYQPLTQENSHIIIIIFPNRESMYKAADLYTDWIGLFSYRNKILWAYSQSRFIKESLVAYYQQAEANQRTISKQKPSRPSNQTVESKLDAIQKYLENYTLDLPKLNLQKQIIEINLFNYQTRLEIISQKVGTENHLEFLEKFSQKVQQKYLLQITKDYENMELGLRLLEASINAIRSQIELEKSQRDRSFQNIVTIVGAGTAVTALIDFEGKQCTAISKLMPLEINCKEEPWFNNVIIPVGLIVIFGVIALFLKKILLRLNR
ncbi:MAG: hypothetical protein F6K36_26780 [Symploca sp. SIO3C6]|nr:hypothetical protein [Symploca sp. SIO3C6]